MTDDREISRIRAHAQDLLRGGMIESDRVIASGHIETPIAVQAPDRKFHSWVVPVTVDNLLAGFFQFLHDGTFMRFSSFLRRAGELAGCPEAADWLDLDRIRTRAEIHRNSDEASGKPFLTYDRSPDRVVWAVPLTKADSAVRHIYVAGRIVYTAVPGDMTGQ